MMHKDRQWGVATMLDNDEIAEKLSEYSYTRCTAFKTAAGIVWANDSTNENAIQEYGVLQRDEGTGEWRQLESITTSWCSTETLRTFLDSADAGEFKDDNWGTVADSQFKDDHQSCPHCM